ncbi:MAG TPA: glycosyltransferase family 39 protein [Vicinamibacterales bacterium]|nr:glycosyltransferase family 39 protein [Vicinamibacterales bacterium]
MTEQPVRPPLWAHVADIAALVLLGISAYVVVNGGFVIRPLSIRISFRSADRAFLWVVGLVVVRHLLLRRPALPERIHEWVRQLARSAGRLRDDAELLGIRPLSFGTWREAVWVLAGVTLLFAALTAGMTYPQALQLGSGVSPDTGDPLFSTWRLAWIAHQLAHDPLHLFNANIFHPASYTLAFSDSVLVPAFMAAPLLWLGVPQLVVYNLVFLAGFALSGVGMFVLVRSLTGQTGAALVAGFVFAFLPFRYMHYAHLELQMAQWMPLGLWALHRTLREGRLRDGLLTGLFFALQVYSAMYYGVFFATFLIPLVGTLLLAGGRPVLQRSLRPLVAGAGLAALLIAPLSIPYVAARSAVGERPMREIAFYSAMPADYLTADSRNALVGASTGRFAKQERALFQGIVVPLVALVGLWPPMSAARIGYLIAMLLAFDVSLGVNGVSYGFLHLLVPPYRGLRVPARMAILVGLSLSILAGYGIARLTSRRSRLAASCISLVVALLVFVEYRPTLVLNRVRTTPPPVYERLRHEPTSVLLELPLKSPDIYLEPVYMYFSTFHWHNLVNGYSGFSPPTYSKLLNLIMTFPDDESVAELRRRGTDFVIVHGALFEGPGYAETVSAMDQRKDFELVGTYPWEGKDTRLYRLRRLPD